MEDDVCEEYKSSLADLSCNSKPLINMLTMLAEDNAKIAPKIVQVIETHLLKVSHEVKLPVMYLIDSIIKNVGGGYQQLFTQNIVSNFCSVFEKVDEKTRIQLFKLRQTWNEIFPSKKLYAIDVRVKSIDPAWPVTAQPNIHVNPKFLENKPATTPTPEAAAVEAQAEVRRQLLEKQQELLRLQQQKLELEKMQIQAQLEKQKIEIVRVPPPSQQLNPLIRPQILAGKMPIQNQSSDPRLTRRDPRVMARDPRVHQRNPLAPKNDWRFQTPPPQPAPLLRTPDPRNMAVPFVSNKPNIVSNTIENIHSSKPEVISKIVEHKKPSSPVKKAQAAKTKIIEIENKDNKTSSTPPVHNLQTATPSPKSSPKKSSQSPSDEKPSSKTKKEKEESNKQASPTKRQKDKKDAKSDSELKTLPPVSPEVSTGNKTTGSPKKKTREARAPVSTRSLRSSKTSPKEKKTSDANKDEDKKIHANKDAEQTPPKRKSERKSQRGSKSKSQDTKSKTPETNSEEKGRQATDVDLRIQGSFKDMNQATNVENSQHEDAARGKKNATDNIEENGEEPVKKKAREELLRVDSLFGEEDKDYRIPPSGDMDSRSPSQKNWAQYKASHPDEFKSPIRPIKEGMEMNTEPFPEENREFRREKYQFSHFRPLPPREAGFDRLGRPLLSKMKSMPRWRHLNSQFHHDQLQLQLMLAQREDIIRQAQEQLRSGRITHHQHREFLNELKRLNEFQRNPRFAVRDPWPMNPRRNADIEPMEVDGFRGPGAFNEAEKERPPPGEPVFIDGDLKRILFFGQTAVVFMDNGEAREVCFQGPPKDVFLDEQKLLYLEFNKTREFEVDGTKHTIRFGAPSREVYVDNQPYKAQFGGNPFPVFINGKMRHFRLSGPLPSVEIGSAPINDLVEKFSRMRPGERNESEMDMRSGGREMPKSGPQSQLDIDMRGGASTSRPRPDDPLPDNPGEDFSGMKDVDMRVNPRPTIDRDVVHSPLRNSPGRNTPPRIPEENLGPGRPQNRPWENIPRREEPPHLGRGQPLLDNFRQGPSEITREGRWSSPSRDFRPGNEWPNQGQNEWDHREDSNGPQFGNFPRNNEKPPWNGPPNPQESGGKPPWNGPPNPQESGGKPPWNAPPNPQDSGGKQPWNGPPNPQESGGKQPWNGPPNPQESGGRTDWGDWRHPNPNKFWASKGSPQQYDEFQFQPSQPPPVPEQRNAAPFNQQYQGNRGGYRMPSHRGGFNNPTRHGSRFHPLTRPPLHPSAHQRDTAPPVPEHPPMSQELAPVQQGLLPPPIASTEQPPALPLDINSLFAKLVFVGLINSESSGSPAQEKPSSPVRERVESREISMIPPVELTPESLRVRYPAVVTCLYKGIQCASCGLRFAEIQNEKYRQHLDWHFRSNRREKDGAKKAFSRKWYYDLEDWTQFEEVEDLEDRARSFFELQADEEQFQTVPPPVISSVPTSKDSEAENACVVCGEKFELFWVEEAEEWHLKDAVRVDEKTYHPLCYEDFKKASEAPETPADESGDKSLEVSLEEAKEEPKSELGENDDQKMDSEDTVVTIKEEIIAEEDKTVEVVAEEETMATETSQEDVKADASEEDLKVEAEVPEEAVPEEPSPPEEEIIGLISEDPTSEEEMPQQDAKMVVVGSGNIVMKMKAESIAQTTSSTPPPPEGDDNADSAQKTDVETDTEDEMVLPPPDPRFTVLPPVQRGTELSGLCSIM